MGEPGNPIPFGGQHSSMGMGGTSAPNYVQQLSWSWQAKQAIQAGALVGLRWGTTLLIIGFTLYFLMGDYATTRKNAADSVAWINQVIANNQAAAQRQQGTPAPAPAPPAEAPPATGK